MVLFAALCLERQPEEVASEAGGGAAGLKALVTDVLNERPKAMKVGVNRRSGSPQVDRQEGMD